MIMTKELINIIGIIGINENKMFCKLLPFSMTSCFKITLFMFMLIANSACMSQGITNIPLAFKDSITNKKVYDYKIVGNMPEFLGKEGNILNYVYKNYKDSLKTGAHFSLALRFVIDSHGNLIGVGLINKNRSQYDEIEADIIKIVKTSPKWRPGRYLKKRVNVLMIITFSGVINEAGRLDRVWARGAILHL